MPASPRKPCLLNQPSRVVAPLALQLQQPPGADMQHPSSQQAPRSAHRLLALPAARPVPAPSPRRRRRPSAGPPPRASKLVWTQSRTVCHSRAPAGAVAGSSSTRRPLRWTTISRSCSARRTSWQRRLRNRQRDRTPLPANVCTSSARFRSQSWWGGLA